MRLFASARLLWAYLSVLLAFPLAGCSISHVMRVENRESIPVQTMLAELKGSRLVFAGERHDAAPHHKLQLEIVKAKQAEGKYVAIAMEMFEDTSQRALNAWSSGRAPEFAIRKVFEANWRNLPWDLYRDILIYARDNRIPIIALNPPRRLVQKVALSGFASLTAAELADLPPGIDARATDAFLDLISSSYPMHGKSGEAFRYLCEAQLLRNKVMARHISDYLRLHPEGSLVAIVGGGHARKTGGVPEELKKLEYKVLLPPIPALDADNVTAADGDYLIEEPFAWLGEIF